MLPILKHLFYDIHSHQEEDAKEIWKLRSLSISKDFIDIIYKMDKPFSIGYHPWFIQESNYQKNLQILEEVAQYENVWAIGETGLDKVIDTNFLLQLEIFQKHIGISELIKKPLIIHCVKAHSEILSLHKALSPSQNWLIHGFRANTQIALQLQKKGIYLSFGEALLKSPKLQETFAQIRAEYFLLETDESSISIEKIYEKAALIRKISLEELQKQIKQNLCKFFSEKITVLQKNAANLVPE